MDASAWIALYDASDGNHSAALSKQQRIREEKALIYTSDYVFDEAITRIRYSAGHSAAVRLGELILNSQTVNLLNVSETVRQTAWLMFRQYDDKRWSFTDCASFVLMKTYRIQYAFSFDQDFAQAGFLIW
jgi:hypothetical protein